MTHEDAGHYAAKHPAGTVPDPAIAAAVEARAEDGRLRCARAHAVAAELGVPPAAVGTVVDLLELRLSHCQLGLFGYRPRSKVLQAAESVPAPLAAALRDAAENGRVSCARCWETAEAFGLKRMTAAAACEHLGLKIKPCQLGAF